ncbi:MAG: hypothetical protein ACYC8W_02670 [Candidatus Tyrphobacter sp.]
MKRISRFNRIFTVHIFVVVASLTAYGYGSLVIDASVGNTVQSQLALYDAYGNVDEAFVGDEIQASLGQRYRVVHPGSALLKSASSPNRRPTATASRADGAVDGD